MTQEFYEKDKALLMISNESGKKVFTQVKVLKVFSEFGRIRYLVSPVSGSGEMKVEKLYKDKSN